MYLYSVYYCILYKVRYTIVFANFLNSIAQFTFVILIVCTGAASITCNLSRYSKIKI